MRRLAIGSVRDMRGFWSPDLLAKRRDPLSTILEIRDPIDDFFFSFSPSNGYAYQSFSCGTAYPCFGAWLSRLDQICTVCLLSASPEPEPRTNQSTAESVSTVSKSTTMELHEEKNLCSQALGT